MNARRHNGVSAIASNIKAGTEPTGTIPDGPLCWITKVVVSASRRDCRQRVQPLAAMFLVQRVKRRNTVQPIDV
jgi:hypothetical protein